MQVNKSISAAAIIIGDEILSGKIHERNSYYLAQVLFERGVDLKRVEVISDEISDIVQSIQRNSPQVDLLFTSGGIGPTHDDRSYEAVAKAFNLSLQLHQPTVDKFHEFHAQRGNSLQMSAAQKKMAILPHPAEVLDVPGLWMPIVHIENTYVLPGVPPLFDKIIDMLAPRFSGPKKKRVLIYTQMYETQIAQSLEQIQNEYPQVAIGSYPQLPQDEYRVMVSLEGVVHDDVDQAAAKSCQAIAGVVIEK